MNPSESPNTQERDSQLESFARLNFAKKRFKRLIIIPIILALVAVFTVICFVFFFKVKTVEVEGAQKYSADLLIIKSGIIAGENLYSYSESRIEDELMLNYPYISNVKLKRRWPDRIILEITEDTAAYVASVYGETLVLSDKLRILEDPSVTPDSLELCELLLPDIDRALVGNKPIFTSDAAYIEKALSVINDSSLRSKITKIDFRSKFAVSFLMGSNYKVKCGSIDELDLKLTMTEKILQSGQIPQGTKAELDVSDPAECTAILGDSANIALD